MLKARFLGRAGNPVDAVGQRTGAVGLDADIETRCMKGIDKRLVHLEPGFSAGKDDHLTPLVGDVVEFDGFGNNLFGGHGGEVRELGVTPRTTEVTSAETNKDCRDARMGSFALKRIEYFVDFIQAVTGYGLRVTGRRAHK